ncbi:glycosyltransferase family 4 protein [Candidatus Falkowbacteria bacterium]|nr:glycosyltransferase family 4 protein [Candidatus Falkowbacteria bacterium]
MPSIRTKHQDAISHTLLATIHALASDYDVIHYHGVGPALLAWLPRVFKPRAKVVVTFHCIDRKHQKWGTLARLALKLGERAACLFAHQTITVSKTLQYYCSQIYNTDTLYIPNGVSRRASHYGDQLIRAAFGLSQQSYIVAVARLVRHKGIHYLIAAYQRLKTDKQLVIVGGSAFTDEYIEELRLLADHSPNIIFTGYQEGAILDQLFANAYVVVHPSESEGLPIAILEAMSYGTAVLASDIAENLEVVKGHGFTFRNKDIANLASKLGTLLTQPKAVAAVGQEARGYVMKQYAWDDIAKKTLELYRELAGVVATTDLAAERV